jgi:hypothetical protein
MKMYGGVGVYLHAFLTSALIRDEWSTSHLGESWYSLDRRLGVLQNQCGDFK